MLWGPPTKVVCHLPKKEYKRADLAGGEHSHGFLHRDFPGETGYMMRASASLRQVWLTHADAFHLDIEKNVLPRLSVRKHVRARLRHVRDPGTTQSAVVPPSTMHPKHTLDGAMGEETASLRATT